MSEPPKKPGVAFWASVVVVAVIGYGTAYLVLMEPMWTIPYFGGDWERYPIYHVVIDDELARRFFGLAHWVDRRCRPEFWSERRPFRGGRGP